VAVAGVSTTVASRAAVLWAADQVLRQHRQEPAQVHEGRDPADIWSYPSTAAGRCAQCDGTDPACWMLGWALAERRSAGPL
jgi:hypothetical protein